MLSDNSQKTYQDFKDRFSAMTDIQLVEAFKSQIGNPGWTHSRSLYAAAMHDEFEKRKLEYSAIGSENK